MAKENKLISSNPNTAENVIGGADASTNDTTANAVFPSYVYKYHQGKEIFISPNECTEDELYCAHCDAYNELQGKYDTREALDAALSELLEEYTCRPSGEEYDAIVEAVPKKEQEIDKAENLVGSFKIFGQGMASIFVVLGLIAVVVGVLKKLDNKKKK